MLAMSYVGDDYPLRVAGNVRTVADLVEYEKLTCRSRTDLSLKLVGLSHYAGDATWQNDLGEKWSVARIVKEELGRPAAGGTTRLLGLSVALERRRDRKQPISGDYARAEKFVRASQDYALEVQSADGSWGPRAFDASGVGDYTATLSASGHVLEWLLVGLPEDRLTDARVVRGIENLDRLLNSQRYRWNVAGLGSREIAAVTHALHALVLYDQRVFQPAEAEKPAPAEKPAASEKVAKKPAAR
jgi:hypothetical protein